VYESWIRQQEVVKAKKEMDKQEAARIQEEVQSRSNKGVSSKGSSRTQLFGSQDSMSSMGSSNNSSSNNNNNSGSSVNNSLTSAWGATQETMEALEERGQRLQNTVERTDQLREV